MIGQGLQRCVESALEWRADDARGEKRLLDDSARLISFLEGAAGDLDKFVQILGEVVQPSGKAA